jgi:hypothetical protein
MYVVASALLTLYWWFAVDIQQRLMISLSHNISSTVGIWSARMQSHAYVGTSLCSCWDWEFSVDWIGWCERRPRLTVDLTQSVVYVGKWLTWNYLSRITSLLAEPKWSQTHTHTHTHTGLTEVFVRRSVKCDIQTNTTVSGNACVCVRACAMIDDEIVPRWKRIEYSDGMQKARQGQVPSSNKWTCLPKSVLLLNEATCKNFRMSTHVRL